jgi:hypothetical protein
MLDLVKTPDRLRSSDNIEPGLFQINSATCSVLNTGGGCFLCKVNFLRFPVLDIETFRTLCKRVIEEKDPAKLEILKERMTIMLANREEYPVHNPDVFVN